MLVATLLTDSGQATALIPDEPVIQVENPVVENRLIEKAEKAAEPKMHLYGVCTITHYCHCAKCNGRAGANCASGVQPTVNHTVASNCLPFGTRLMIEGQEYFVEDRGDANMDSFWIDIFVGSHEEALQRGMYKANVFIIDG